MYCIFKFSELILLHTRPNVSTQIHTRVFGECLSCRTSQMASWRLLMLNPACVYKGKHLYDILSICHTCLSLFQSWLRFQTKGIYKVSIPMSYRPTCDMIEQMICMSTL